MSDDPSSEHPTPAVTRARDDGSASADRRAEQLLTLSAALASATSTDRVAEAIIQAALPIFQATVGLVALLSEDGSRLDCERVVGVPPAEAERWRSFPADARLPLADAVRERRLVVLLSDDVHDAAYPAMVTERAAGGNGAVVAAPLMVGDRCIGGLGLICPPERCREDEQRTFLWTLAGQCALSLERARLYDAERRAREEALADIGERTAIEAALRVSETRFRALADNIAQLAWMADADGSLFWYNQRWFDYTGTTLEEMHGWGWAKVQHPDHLGPVTERWREHLAAGRSWEDTFPLRGKDGNYRWFLSRAFPIRDEKGSVALWCGTNTDVTDLREAEAKLATAYRREVMLNQIGQAIRATRDPDQIQAAAVRALGETLGADRAYFNLLDVARDRSWVGQDFRRADLPSLAGEYRISDYQVDPAAYYPDGRTMVVADAQAMDWPAPLAEAIRSLRVRSAINVPLFDNDALVGTLAVAMADEPRDWTDEEVALVETVAFQTRAALDAARLQEREHRIAEQLAQALQPATPTRAPGLALAEYYRPAWEDQGVGGDFSDVFSTDKGVTFLVVGDLSGKGLAAASQVATVRHMLRFALLNGQTVAGPVRALNRTLAEHGLLTGFATLFVGRYDAMDRALTYVNCGQDAGLVLRAATGDVEPLPPTGPVLGATESAAYTEETVILARADALALYTDGLTEAGPSRTSLLTGDGVADLLRELTGVADPQEIVTRLMDGIDSFAGSGVRDDQCLLVAIASG